MKKESVYRINFVGRIVKCGILYTNNNVFKLSLFLSLDKKFEIDNFNIETITNNFNDLNDFIHINKDYKNLIFLNDFKRKRKDKNKNKNKPSYSNKIEEEIKLIAKKEKENISKQNETREKIKNRIIKNNKNKVKLKSDIFETFDTLGTLGDFFNKQYNEENNFYKNTNIKSTNIIHIKKNKQKHEKYNTLVLWDIENVNFFNDYSVVSRIIPKKSYKVFSYSKKNNKKMIYLKGPKLNYVLSKLKNRNWIEKRTTKIADNELIEEFNKRKNKISNFILISADKDFKNICDEAIKLGIRVFILNNEKRNNEKSWFSNPKYNYKFIDNSTIDLKIL